MQSNPHEPMRRTRPTALQRDAGWWTVRTCRPGRGNVRRLEIALSAGWR